MGQRAWHAGSQTHPPGDRVEPLGTISLSVKWIYPCKVLRAEVSPQEMMVIIICKEMGQKGGPQVLSFPLVVNCSHMAAAVWVDGPADTTLALCHQPLSPPLFREHSPFMHRTSLWYSLQIVPMAVSIIHSCFTGVYLFLFPSPLASFSLDSNVERSGWCLSCSLL